MKQIAPYVKEHVSTLESIVPYRMVFRYQSTAGNTDLFSVWDMLELIQTNQPSTVILVQYCTTGKVH